MSSFPKVHEISLEVNIHKPQFSRVLIGRLESELPKLLDDKKVLIICEPILEPLIRRATATVANNCDYIPIFGGEGCKNLEIVEQLWKEFVEHQIDRQSLIVSVGGGSLCDVVGFAASTYHRGVPFGFVPSTLLSQVDASIGGKNGINFAGAKNILGATQQPTFVLCDVALLETLPQADFISGLAEVVKAAIIGDPELFNFIDQNCSKILARDVVTVNKVVFDAIKVKAKIVQHDPFEHSERLNLNLGHTIAHIVEMQCGVSHGHAVAFGIVLEGELSIKLGIANSHDIKRIENLIAKIGFNMQLSVDIDWALFSRDKKSRGDQIWLPLIRSIGAIERVQLDKIFVFELVHEVIAK